LTREKFDQLVLQSCHYCKTAPSNVERVQRKTDAGYFLYSGIDRKDNTRSYEEANCVSCCRICNRAKNDLTYSVFCQYIERIKPKY
jgi:hypothetical protein